MILSIGADGKFAGLVVQAFASRGARVRGLIRMAENGDKAKANGATEVAVGDLRDKDSLASVRTTSLGLRTGRRGIRPRSIGSRQIRKPKGSVNKNALLL
jgi:hypothetical protein